MVNSVLETDQPSSLSPKQCYEHRQHCRYQLLLYLAAVTLGHNTFLLNESHNNDPRWSTSRNHEQVCGESADNCDWTIAAREVLLCPENFLPCLFLFATKANTKSRYSSGSGSTSSLGNIYLPLSFWVPLRSSETASLPCHPYFTCQSHLQIFIMKSPLLS